MPGRLIVVLLAGGDPAVAAGTRPGDEVTTSFIEAAGEDPRGRLDEAR